MHAIGGTGLVQWCLKVVSTWVQVNIESGECTIKDNRYLQQHNISYRSNSVRGTILCRQSCYCLRQCSKILRKKSVYCEWINILKIGKQQNCTCMYVVGAQLYGFGIDEPTCTP